MSGTKHTLRDSPGRRQTHVPTLYTACKHPVPAASRPTVNLFHFALCPFIYNRQQSVYGGVCVWPIYIVLVIGFRR